MIISKAASRFSAIRPEKVPNPAKFAIGASTSAVLPYLANWLNTPPLSKTKICWSKGFLFATETKNPTIEHFGLPLCADKPSKLLPLNDLESYTRG